MIKYLLSIICFFLLATASVQAQDPIFSQFYAAPLVVNPAFAGTNFAPRISAVYRNQYPQFADNGATAYSTYTASYEQFIPALRSGFGAMLLADNAGGGLMKNTNFGAFYSYRIDVNDEFHLKLGVTAGFRQTSLDWDRLVFLDQLDPITGPTDPFGNPNPSNETRPESLDKTIFDVGTGLLAYNSTFYGGLSLQHLTTPDEGFYATNSGLAGGLPLRLSVQGGAQFVVKEGNKRQPASFISPNVLFVKQGDQGQVNLGAYYSMGLVFAGGWYRHAFSNTDAAIALVGFQYGVFKIGYSFDLSLGDKLAGNTGGSHEISLVINLENSQSLKRKRFAERYNDCFKIFH